MHHWLAIGLGLSLILASNATARPFDDWYRMTGRRCPSHHVEWICGDCQLSLVEAFDDTLSRAQKRNVAKIADINHACADESAGFSCEMAQSIHAYEKLGLMSRFVDYGCRHIRCEEAASCSKLPPRVRVIETPTHSSR